VTSSKFKKKSLRRSRLIERKHPNGRFIEFPQMQGRTVRRIEFSTSRDYHAFTIFFEDNTKLNIALEPQFRLRGRFSVIKEWPIITSISDEP